MPSCGPTIKYRRPRSLGKEVFDEYRYFLPKNHSYRTTNKEKFNGKEENGKKPRRMTPRLWKLNILEIVKVRKLFMYDLLYKYLVNFISIKFILSH